MSKSEQSKKIPLIRRPWFAFLSSMRFAVALLCLLAIASVIGTFLKQNESATGYLVKFGSFWYPIFDFLGLYDVYSSAWFVTIMLFLVASTVLCLWRNIPPLLKEMRSFRLKATEQSLQYMKNSVWIESPINESLSVRYLSSLGFAVRVQKNDGNTLIAAKKGMVSKLGYIFAHVAIIVICLGGLIDSSMLMKLGILSGRLLPDNTTLLAKDFRPESHLGVDNPSFRGDISISEGSGADVVFINTGKGFLVQDLPFSVDLKKFEVDYYRTGMPKNFASHINIIDKKTGKETPVVLKVNHPFTTHGITLYQASFGDGGSDLHFRAWNLQLPSRASEKLSAVSMNTFPLQLDNQDYHLEFGELRPINVEDIDSGEVQPGDLKQKLKDVHNVYDNGDKRNVGPTITYKIRDSAGQAVEYVNYMQPLQRELDWFYATGIRSGLDENYRWLMLPADVDGKLDTFMAFREILLMPELREKVVNQAIKDVDPALKQSFGVAVRSVMRIFSEGGYLALEDFITTQIASNQQDKMREFFYQVLYGTTSVALDEALTRLGHKAWAGNDEKRNRFLLNSLDGYTGLTRVRIPILLQLDGFREVRSSGIQMTRSPGQGLVYLGSIFLVLGTLFMFYIHERRAWILIKPDGVRFAMSTTRHERELARIFPEYVKQLKKIAKDFSDE